MRFKEQIGPVALSIALFSLLAVGKSPDEALEQGILGVWRSHFKWVAPNNTDSWIEARGVDEYFAGGEMRGVTDYTEPGGESRLEYTAKWHIAEGYLIVEVLEARGGFLKAGAISRDKIVSLGESRLELQAEDGQRVVLHR